MTLQPHNTKVLSLFAFFFIPPLKLFGYIFGAVFIQKQSECESAERSRAHLISESSGFVCERPV